MYIGVIMYSIRLWTFVAALLLALSCGVVNVHAGRLGTSPGHGSSSIASADEKASRIYLRQLQSAPRTEEVTILKEGTARRGRSVAATATCPTGMTKSEVLECSRNNTKFTRRTEKDKVVDGHVVGSTCRCGSVCASEASEAAVPSSLQSISVSDTLSCLAHCDN